MDQVAVGDSVVICDRSNKMYYRTICGEEVMWTKDLGDALKFERPDNVFQSLIRIGRHTNKARQNPIIELHIIKRQGWIKIGTINHF